MTKPPKTYQRIKDSSPTLERVKPDEVARALGAVRTGSTSKSGRRLPSVPQLDHTLIDKFKRTGRA